MIYTAPLYPAEDSKEQNETAINSKLNFINHLPNEILSYIFSMLSIEDLISIQYVDKKWHDHSIVILKRKHSTLVDRFMKNVIEHNYFESKEKIEYEIDIFNYIIGRNEINKEREHHNYNLHKIRIKTRAYLHEIRVKLNKNVYKKIIELIDILFQYNHTIKIENMIKKITILLDLYEPVSKISGIFSRELLNNCY